MPESKKYWYIQLNVNFFEDDRIDWLCEQQNGYAYVVLYLKLCLKTANNNGVLTRQIGNMIIPYNVDKIAEITHINVDIVRVALELYKKIGLVYEADAECNFMRLPEVPGMVGCVTQAALDKRKQRERKQLGEGQSPDDVPDNVQDNVQQELRDKSKEIRVNKQETQQEKEGEKGRKRPPARFVPPTLEEVKEYAKSRGSDVDPKKFWDYFNAGDWKDSEGKQVRSWKQKFITWERSGNGKRAEESRPQMGVTKKAAQAAQQNYQPTSDRIQEQSDWMDQFLAEQREQEEQERYES